MFQQVEEAKPGFLQLSGDQLTPVWFSSTVLLTALGFYMWPHTFGSALSAQGRERVQAQRGRSCRSTSC